MWEGGLNGDTYVWGPNRFCIMVQAFIPQNAHCFKEISKYTEHVTTNKEGFVEELNLRS